MVSDTHFCLCFPGLALAPSNPWEAEWVELGYLQKQTGSWADWQGFSVQWELRPCGTLVLCGSDEAFYHVTWLACQNMH